MKRVILLSLSTALLFSACKQSGTKSVSSLTSSYCDCLTKNKDLPDSLKVDSCDRLVLTDTLANIESDSAAAAFLDDFDAQMTKDCKEYKSATGGPATSDDNTINWAEADTALASKMSEADCQEFFNNLQFSYEEPDSPATTTNVTIDNGVWTESIKEGKYFSKLGFKPDGACGFALVFQESNDPVKGQRSKKGEIYKYRVIEKKGNYYMVLGVVKGKGLLFKLYH